MTDPTEPEVWVTRSPASASISGWLQPSPDQMDHARKMLAEDRQPEARALGYIGGVLNRFAAADFDADSFRIAIAMYRVYTEEFS